MAQRLYELHSLFRIARVKQRESDHTRAMRLLRKEWQWRRLPKHRPNSQIIRRRRHELPVFLENGLGLCERIDDQPTQQIRAHGMQPELKAGHNAEVASSSPNGPEQFAVLRGAYSDDLPGRR